MSDFNKIDTQCLNPSGFTGTFRSQYKMLQFLIEQYNALIDVNSDIDTKLAGKEDSVNITNNRKLSADGDLTGTLCNGEKTACQVVTEINTNINHIGIIEDQINEGVIGQTLLINCGTVATRDGIFNTVIDCGLVSQRI